MGNIVLWVLPALHLIICAVIFAMMRLNKLRTRHVIFPAVVLLPVCGYMLLFIDEWQARHSRQALRDVEEYGRTQGEAVWRREVIAGKDDDFIVPLEEAMTVNSPVVSRKLMMKLLHANPEQYVELLKRVTLSDDVELTHYASTSMMEIQSGYEERIGRLLEEIRLNPEDSYALVKCRNELKAYIDSGFITDTVLRQYRMRLHEVLEKLCVMQPEAVRYEFEYIENSIMLGITDGIDKRLALLEKKYPQDIRVYCLYVQYYYCTNNGERIKDVLQEIKDKDIYLDSSGRQWMDVWSHAD
jgi:hypothetical protein